MFGWLDRDKIFVCKISKIWAEWMILSMGIHYDVIGLDNLRINKQYVFMSNHVSALDILLGFVAIPNTIVFLAKKELFEISLIEKYLPEQLSEDSIREVVKDIIQSSGAESMQDMGRVMGTVMKELAGSSDGKLVQKVVQDELR